MTPQQKAIDLVGNLLGYTKDIDLVLAKVFALMIVDELINSTLYGIDLDLYEGQYNENCIEYWQEVKNEIENI